MATPTTLGGCTVWLLTCENSNPVNPREYEDIIILIYCSPLTGNKGKYHKSFEGENVSDFADINKQ